LVYHKQPGAVQIIMIKSGVLLEEVSCMAGNLQIFQKNWWSGISLKLCQPNKSQALKFKRKKYICTSVEINEES
jgi:hypothetical protein